ncbi:MAG: pseudouridine synthase [Bacteroidales bacterium]|nr:pseudouridine synthase [Bacteroidales bacterium]
MEEKKYERRSDYAGRNESRGGYSSEGRKLRPRRNAGPAASSTSNGEYRSYDHQRSHSNDFHSSERSSRPSYGQRRSYGENSEGGDRRPYSQGRPSYGQRRSFGAGSSEGGERRSYPQSRPSYGQRRSFGENAEGGERRSFSQSRPSYGHGRNTEGGERRSFSQSRPSYGQRRSFGENAEGGERKPFAQGRPSSAPRRSFGSKPGFGAGRGNGRPGGNKFGRRDDNHFTETDEAGINQMLSRRPQIDESAYSDNDIVPTPIKEEVRLNKYIANSGVCSRREADNFILAGVVTVNGEVVTELGTKVNVLTDDIRFNGEKLKGEEKVYIVMNKPKGYVTSASDPHAEKTVMDLLKGLTVRVFPVGRLDKSTTGVLMFTNDGEIAEQLTHPSYNKKKIYQVILDKALDESDKVKILTEGLELNDGNIKADELEYIDAHDHRRLGIEIHSGKNRIVRRIFESLGYEVKALDRVYFAGLTKKGLKKGEWRYLSEGEVNVLKMGAYV